MIQGVETHPQRMDIINWLQAGEDPATVAAKLQPSLHRTTIWRYQKEMRTRLQEAAAVPATVVTALEERGLLKDGAEVAAVARVVAQATQTIVGASPFRERLESLWQRTEKSITRAEDAVRAVTDRETGQLVAIGADVSAIAPLLNQAHKNLELLGQVTGELAPASSGPTVNIQINVPAGSTVQAAKSGDVIDIE